MQVSSSISEQSFRQVRDWLYQRSGIFLNDTKRSLVCGRLQKRMRELELASFEQYIRVLLNPAEQLEHELAVNILTTNETYFFREEKHFRFLEKVAAGHKTTTPAAPFQVWSAAASTGQEAYSVAMVLAQQFGGYQPWSVVGTDINTAVLCTARQAIYPIEASRKIPQDLLKAYALKGKGKDEGWFKFRPELCQKVSFEPLNLMEPKQFNYRFDLILLRNVLIYFELEDKQKIVRNVLKFLKPGGYLLVGHSESIHGYDDRLQQIQPACYRLKA
ncbi:CheR family methyltransferase [Rheinheimera sp.]|uniref:CheR family methyltransferase n=1 Tax=Rheinheimera sp. TaxID=1869214 RepID=UPI00307D82A4